MNKHLGIKLLVIIYDYIFMQTLCFLAYVSTNLKKEKCIHTISTQNQSINTWHTIRDANGSYSGKIISVSKKKFLDTDTNMNWILNEYKYRLDSGKTVSVYFFG